MAIPHIPRDLYNVTATILSATATVDDLGEVSRTFTSSGTCPARLDKYRYAGSPSAWAEQGIVDVPTHKLFCPAETDVLPGDRVVVDGTTYEVIEAYEPGGYAHHKEVWLKYA